VKSLKLGLFMSPPVLCYHYLF